MPAPGAAPAAPSTPPADPAARTAPTAADAAATRTVVLDKRQSALFPVRAFAQHRVQAEPFAKEPPSGPGQVVRGRLLLGGQPEHEQPFLYDREAGRLILDINRNGDLTDDPVLANQVAGSRTAFFSNARLRFPIGSGEVEYLADIALYPRGREWNILLRLQSVWTGKFDWGDRAWELAAVENPASSVGFGARAELVIRPWEDRDKPWDPRFTTDPNAARRLFLAGQEFEVSGRWDAGTNGPTLALDLAPRPSELGSLNLAGRDIHWLVLQGEGRLAAFRAPGATLELPAGTYRLDEVRLRAGALEAVRAPFAGVPLESVVVRPDAPARLKVGGPLTNSVAATRHGDILRLNYELRGADGALYNLASTNRTEPPSFAIYNGGTKVASGRFQYG
jgi:hypothetical protein